MLTLKRVIEFADQNKIDYNTAISEIVNACKAVDSLKKNAEVEEPKEVEKINVQAEKWSVKAEQEKLLRYYNMDFSPKVIIGARVAEYLNNAKFFHPENVLIIKPNLVYLGYFDYETRDQLENPEQTEQPGIKVFVDTSEGKNPREAYFNCYESYASKDLKSLMPEVQIERAVCR